MMRRLVLFLLVPALMGGMVGLGVGVGRMQASSVVVDEDPGLGDVAEAAPVELPPPPPADPVTLPPPVRPSPSEQAPPPPSYDVAAVQQRLGDLGYYGGAVDGEAGPRLRSAVMAFQKVHGLAADGVVGPQTLAALEQPVTPPLQGGPPTRIEIDLTKQVLYYVENDRLVRILPVSSGSGQTYRTKSGGRARSLTPVGTYHIQRRIRGVRNADLGTLYDPLYFYKGWAIHGSNSVPAYPASHGCIRVTRPDALWLFDRAPVGMPVVIYGGVHTFPAGSSAPGTDTPAGDTPAQAPVADPAAPAQDGQDGQPASPPPEQGEGSAGQPPEEEPSPKATPTPTPTETGPTAQLP